MACQDRLKFYAIIGDSVLRHFSRGVATTELTDMVFRDVLAELGGHTFYIPQNSKKKRLARNEKLLIFYEQGSSVSQISKQLNMNASVIYAILSERGVVLRQPQVTASQSEIYMQEDVEAYFSGGFTPERIATKLHISRAAVLARIKAMKSVSQVVKNGKI